MSKPEWGLGGPQLVRKSTKSRYEKVVGFFDIHYDKHEPELWDCALQAIEWIKPHRVVFGGDLTDQHLISRWNEVKRRAMSDGEVSYAVKKDLQEAGDIFFGSIREIIPNAVIDFVEGNHDERARKWQHSNTDIAIERFCEDMQMNKYNVNWHPRCGFRLRKEFIIKHGDYTSMNNAKKEYEMSQCGGWSGHKHDENSFNKTLNQTSRRYRWDSAPTMCRVDYDYGFGQSGLANWPQGFLVGMFSTKNQYDYHTDIARWWQDRLLLRGRKFYARKGDNE